MSPPQDAAADAGTTDAASDMGIPQDTGPTDMGPARVAVEISPPVSQVTLGRSRLLAAIELRSDGTQAMLRDGLVWSLSPAAAGEITQLPNGAVSVRTQRLGTITVSVETQGDVALGEIQVGPAEVDQVSAHQSTSAALMSDGTVYAWGWNTYGQVDGAPLDQRLTPVLGPSSNVEKVEAGGEMTLMLLSDDTVLSAGRNDFGQLGQGAVDAQPQPIPSLVVNEAGTGPLEGVVDVAAGYSFALALLEDGRVVTWGYNAAGQLAQADLQLRDTPVQVMGLPPIDTIAAGAAHALVVDENGNVWAWGRNEFGQMGDGITAMADAVPNLVQGPGGVGLLEDIEGVAAGQNHSLAYRRRETSYAWGRNTWGQLGDYTNTDRPLPRRVGSPGDPTVGIGNSDFVAAAYNSSYIWTTSDNFYAFGLNNLRQLGLSDDTDRVGPTRVSIGGTPVDDLESFAAGGSHAVLLRRDGRVWAWGAGNLGQLGTGGIPSSADPTVVAVP